MEVAKISEHEQERLKALKSYHILDSEDEVEFDEIVQLASQICESEISLISLIDESRQWFKAKVGLIQSETPRDHAFCAHAIHNVEIMEVADARADQRFFDNPLVLEDPRIRFYAGMPLETEAGHRLGTLCVIDSQPKTLNDKQRLALKILANQVIKLMELRIKNFQMQENIEVRNRLLSVIAHDVKGPLKSIGDLAEYMNPQEMNEEEMAEAVHEIKKVANSASELVGNILNWAKSLGQSQLAHRHHIVLPDVIAEIKDLYGAMLKKKDLKITTSLAVDTVYGDREMIRFILRNLISNAIKYSEKNNIELTTNSLKMGYWQLSVVDHGVGLGEDQQKKLFNWDQRYTSLGTNKEKGTGIGLLLVKEFVTKHNGSLTIESEVGKGTSIIVKLKNQ